jgi:K+-sensing histidine kinase KdpD
MDARRGSAFQAIRQYGLALVFVSAAHFSTLLLSRFFPYPFLLFFFAAVMAAAWFCGTGPGLFAVLASTLLVDYFFLPPLYSFALNTTDGVYFGAFVTCAVLASWVSASKRKTEEALREARDHLETRVVERTAELERSLHELRETIRERERLETEKTELSDRLETRKVVERAKGILQRELKISEADAYRAMQRESQQKRKPMKEISESIILNDELKRNAR